MPSPRAFVLSAALLCSTHAFADEDLKDDLRGIFLHGTYVEDTFGKAIPVLVDARWTAITSFDQRKHLRLWDFNAGFTGGYGGNTNPKFLFFGVNASASGELGWRLTPQNHFSPYLSGRVVFDGYAVALTGVALNAYETVNSVEGLGGLGGSLALRANIGVSILSNTHSLLLTVFVQEAARRPGSSYSGPIYSEAGFRGQFDLPHNFNAALEATYGTTFAVSDEAFDATNQASRFEATAVARKMLGRCWLALDGKLGGSANTVTYHAAKTVYRTSTPSIVFAGLAFGVSL